MSKRREPIDGLPGWYRHPHMYESLCFWDGDDWTAQYAPAPVEPVDFWQGVRMVGLGTAAGAVLLAFLFGMGAPVLLAFLR